MNLFNQLLDAVTGNWHYIALFLILALLAATGLGLEYSAYLEEERKED